MSIKKNSLNDGYTYFGDVSVGEKLTSGQKEILNTVLKDNDLPIIRTGSKAVTLFILNLSGKDIDSCTVSGYWLVGNRDYKSILDGEDISSLTEPLTRSMLKQGVGQILEEKNSYLMTLPFSFGDDILNILVVVDKLKKEEKLVNKQ